MLQAFGVIRPISVIVARTMNQFTRTEAQPINRAKGRPCPPVPLGT